MRNYTTDVERKRNAILTVSITEPIDWLWRRVQRVEVEGYAIQDLADDKKNPFMVCARELFAMLAEPLVSKDSSGVVSWVLNHLAPPTAEDRLKLIEELRARVANIAGHAWWRLEVPHADFPFKLCALFDPRLTAEHRLAEAERFWATPSCCLDPDSSGKLKTLYHGPAHMLHDKSLEDSVRLFGRHGRLSNMDIERLLALVKSGSPERRPNLEHVVSAGFFNQMLAKHRAHGCRDPRVQSTKDLLADGAPLAASRSRRTATQPSKNRPHLAYANAAWADYKRAQANASPSGGPPKFARSEWARFMSDAAKKYSELPEATRSTFQHIAQVNALRGGSGTEAEADGVADRVNSSWHWQISEDSLPFGVAALRGAMCEKCELPMDTSVEQLPGLTAISDRLREEVLQQSVVRDRGCMISYWGHWPVEGFNALEALSRPSIGRRRTDLWSLGTNPTEPIQ